MLTRLIFNALMLVCSLVMVVGCTNPTTSPSPTPEVTYQTQNIYQSLSITPQPNNQLCWYDKAIFTDNWDSMINNPVFNSGLAYGIYSQNAKQIGHGTYEVALNMPLQFTYRGYYHNSVDSDATLPVRYIALLNEVQLPTAFDNKDLPYQDMVFNYHQTQTFNISVPPLGEGIHELFIIGIQQADIFDDGRAGVFAMRITLIVGNPALLVDRTHYVQIISSEYRTVANATTYWSLSLHSNQSHLIWDYPNVYKPVTDRLNFYMSVGYMEDINNLTQRNIIPQPQPIALIALLDYLQVPIQPDKMVFYGLLSPDNAYSYIPANIDVSAYSGKKELLVIQISYPRIPHCLLIPPPIEEGGHFFYFAIDVRRHGVNVQNDS